MAKKQDAVNTGTHPIDLEDGSTLNVGQSAKVDPEHPHHSALIDADTLSVVSSGRTKSEPHPGTSEEDA